jgi:hypothetical protein
LLRNAANGGVNQLLTTLGFRPNLPSFTRRRGLFQPFSSHYATHILTIQRPDSVRASNRALNMGMNDHSF